jgi:uncharacterized membrane protein
MRRATRAMRAMRERNHRGQVSVLLVGFAAVLMMAIALVVDASAAYLQRSGLNTLADGAALSAADHGASGTDVYDGGLTGPHLAQTPDQARAAVGSYLASTGAFATYPGLTFVVVVDVAAKSVHVSLRAPLDLPLSIPGSPTTALVGANGSAVTSVGWAD